MWYIYGQLDKLDKLSKWDRLGKCDNWDKLQCMTIETSKTNGTSVVRHNGGTTGRTSETVIKARVRCNTGGICGTCRVATYPAFLVFSAISAFQKI